MSTTTAVAACFGGTEGDRAHAHESYLTIQEFAARSRLSESTVRRLIDRGQLPVFQPGGKRTRFTIPASALQATQRRHGAALPGPLDRPPVPSSPPAGPFPPGSAAATEPKVAGQAPSTLSRARAPSSQPSTRRHGPLPKWRQALLKHAAPETSPVPASGTSNGRGASAIPQNHRRAR